ncbi:Cohesin domain protein [compost metagenome]
MNAVNASGESAYSNEVSVTLPLLIPQLDVVIAEEKVNVGQEFTSNIVLRNTTGIYAEDFTIQYDNVHLEYLGFEEVPGYKVYNAPTENNGTIRFVVASQGAGYGINSETVFLKLKFKAKAVGAGKVDATKGRIADTNTEFDLDEANCLEDTVIIQNQDVNMSGEYTLLDLAIDAAHFEELGSTVDPTKYVANQVGDDTIRDEDLVFIVTQMLSNTNYAPNYR